MQQINKTRIGLRADQRSEAFDPAPSVWRYKLQRWWLTPVFRTLIRVGLPAFCVVFFTLSFLSKDENVNYISDLVSEAQTTVRSRPEHLLHAVAVEGASAALSDDINAEFSQLFPISALELDLDALRAGVEDLPTVSSAVLRINSGGILSVEVVEVQPEFLWRTTDGLALLAADGRVLRQVTRRADFPDLPLVAGRGADKMLTQATQVLNAAGPLAGRVRGLVRIGERRWDLVLQDNQKIMLPEMNPMGAMQHVIVLDIAQDILGRDVAALDVRNPRRPTLRLRAAAAESLRAAKGIMIAEFVK